MILSCTLSPLNCPAWEEEPKSLLNKSVWRPPEKIGFLTEWQLYAQKIEGDSWVGEKLDPAKVEKMSGAYLAAAPLTGVGAASLAVNGKTNALSSDQQLGQLYELSRSHSKPISLMIPTKRKGGH